MPATARPKPRRVTAVIWSIAGLGAIVAGFWAVPRRTPEPDRPPAIQARPDSRRAMPPTRVPIVPEQEFEPLTTEQAIERNTATPVAAVQVEPAKPFVLSGALTPAVGRRSAIECLTSAIYYEAASESDPGQRAVAQVVLNRVRHPAFPKSVCGVVYQGSERATGCQFTFTCDGSLARRPSEAGWRRAQRIALAALSGRVERQVGHATHYHTVWVVPYWASTLDKIGTIGAHIFYQWRGYWGRPAAFTGRYAGEPDTPDGDAVEVPPVPPTLADEALALQPPPGSKAGMAAERAGRLKVETVKRAEAASPYVRADAEGGSLKVDETVGKLLVDDR